MEDVAHFIINCQQLSDQWGNFISKLSSTNKAFAMLPTEAKVKYLYFNETIPKVDLNIASDMLCSLKVARDILLAE